MVPVDIPPFLFPSLIMVFFKPLAIFTVLFLLSIFMVSEGLKFSKSEECTKCFQALGGGCKTKIEKASSNPALSRKAMKDCLCTDKYFDNFDDCATCSLQSVGSDGTASEHDRSVAKKACDGIDD